jgi:hypothetical protein
VRTLAAILGGMIIVAVWVNVAVTLLIPRGRVGFIAVIDRFVDRAYSAALRPVRSWERRDGMLASQPAATLGLLLLTWLAGFEAGFGLLLWLPGGTLPAALREAGSSLFTLGFADRGAATPSVIDFFTAASGLVIVALQIAYLPTMYAAYNRREPRSRCCGPGPEARPGDRNCWPGCSWRTAWTSCRSCTRAGNAGRPT